MKLKTVIAQFVKSPETDQVKTRLQPHLTKEQATQVHIKLACHVAQKAACFRAAELALWSSAEGAFVDGLSQKHGVAHYRQLGSGLGERLLHTVQSTLVNADAVILIGSDCPFIDEGYLDKAIAQLSQNDVVIGPASDGGYVLLGLKKSHVSLFQGIAWGTDAVCEQTIEKIKCLGLSYAALSTLADIDRPEDLDLLRLPGWEHLLKMGNGK